MGGGRGLPVATEIPTSLGRTAQDATSLGWDGNGNLLDDGTLRYGWDSRNQLGQFAYGPFGESDTTADHPFQYTGRENDGTGLYQYRNRYYSPTMKRFISEDPIGMVGSGPNLYAYVNDDPLNQVDPLGTMPQIGPIFLPPPTADDIVDVATPTTGYNAFNLDGLLGLGVSGQVSCNGKFSLGVNGGIGIGVGVSVTHQSGTPTNGQLSIVGSGQFGIGTVNASVNPSDGTGGLGSGFGAGFNASLGLSTTIGPKDHGC